MLELSTLQFNVNTDKLKEAHNLLQGLVPAIQGVATASGKMAKDTTQTAKATEEVGKAAERTGKKLSVVERAAERQSLKNKILRGEVIQLVDAQVQLDKVFTSGQAGQLASLKLAGATADQYGKMASEIRDYNQMVGANKFDDSVNGLTKLRKEVQELTLVQKLQADGYQLTAKEIRDLSRDEKVLQQSLDKGQISREVYNQRLKETRAAYIEESAKKAQLIQQSKLAEEQIKREAQAQARSAAMMGEDAVRLFRENEAAKKAAVKAAREAEKERRAEARATAKAVAEAEKEQQAAIQRTLDMAKNAGRTLAMIGRSGQLYGTGGGGGAGPKPPGEQPMDKAMTLFYKEQERNAKALAKANQFLATEMQRVDSVLTELNREHTDGSMLSERHAASVAKFSNSLKMAGVSGTQAAAQLEAYRGKMQQIEALENKRAQNRLANALAPQISDVAVSLAGGMPLHLVIMQQGLQIRDLIGQSGVAAEHLQKTMRDAMKNMVTSIGGTVAALAQMTGGALMDAGKGMSNFLLQISGANAGLDILASKSTVVSGAISGLRTGFAVTAGALTGGMIVALAATAYETVKLIGANNDLARSLAVTGGVFGVTFSQQQMYIDGLVSIGASTRDAIDIINQMSKTSKLSSDEIQKVGQAAIQMQKYAGIAIEDTVKAFDKIAGDPVKGLIELVKRTGDVSPQVVKLVIELEKQGRTAEASALAVNALAEQHSKATTRMQQDLNPLTQKWIDFKNVVSQGWAFLTNQINKGLGNLPEVEALQQQIKDIQAVRSGDVFAIARAGANPQAYSQENLRILQSRLGAIIRLQGEEGRLQKIQSDASAELEKQKAAEEKYATKAEQKSKALADLELNRSRISKEAYDESKKRIEDQFKDKDAGKAAAAAARYEKSAIEKLNDAYNKTVSKARELSDIEKAMLDIRDDPDYLKRNAAGRKEIEDYAIQLHKKAEAEALVKKEQDFTKDSLGKLNEAYSKSIGAVKNLTEVERDWLRIQGEAGFVQLSTERKNALEAEANALIARTKALLEARDAEKDSQTLRSIGQQREDVVFGQRIFALPEDQKNKLKAEYDFQKKLKEEQSVLDQEIQKAMDSTDSEFFDSKVSRLYQIHNEKVRLLKEQHDLETRTLTDMEKRQQAFDGVVKRGFEQMGDSLIDFALTGKSSFGDMIQSMLIDLAKLEMRMQMMKWYESMGGSGKDGITGTLLKAAGSLFGLSSYDGGGFTGYGPRVGGIDGKGGSLAVVHPNETIIDHTKGQRMVTASGSNTKVDVVIINNSGAQVKQQETVDSRGNRKVEVVVGEMASGEVQRSGSAMQRGIGSTFGMRPALIAR